MCEFKALLVRGDDRTLLMDDVVVARVEQEGVVLVDVALRKKTIERATIASADLGSRELLIVPREGRC